MTREELDIFRQDKPLLTLAGLSKEMKKGRNYLQNALPPSGLITDNISIPLLEVLKKYGHKV